MPGNHQRQEASLYWAWAQVLPGTCCILEPRGKGHPHVPRVAELSRSSSATRTSCLPPLKPHKQATHSGQQGSGALAVPTCAFQMLGHVHNTRTFCSRRCFALFHVKGCWWRRTQWRSPSFKLQVLSGCLRPLRALGLCFRRVAALRAGYPHAAPGFIQSSAAWPGFRCQVMALH